MEQTREKRSNKLTLASPLVSQKSSTNLCGLNLKPEHHRRSIAVKTMSLARLGKQRKISVFVDNGKAWQGNRKLQQSSNNAALHAVSPTLQTVHILSFRH